MPNCLTRYGAQPSRCQSVLPVAFSSLYLDIDNHAHHAGVGRDHEIVGFVRSRVLYDSNPLTLHTPVL